MTTVQRNYTMFEENTSKPLKDRVRYEKVFIEAVDDGLSILGESAKKSVYFHLERIYGIKKKDIPFKTEEFAKVLQQIFGLGSKIILIEIMKKFHEKQRFHHKELYEKQLSRR
jgi:adenylyl- and sulfurtransferase ThiI